MKRKEKKATPEAEPKGSETPFFARFLEGQDAEAKLNAPKSGADAKAATPQLMTLKYPSDRDEIVYRPYYIKSATTAKAGATARTLKYPSDRDEIDYYAVYVDAKDVPRTQKAGAKLKEANVKLTSKPPEGDEG